MRNEPTINAKVPQVTYDWFRDRARKNRRSITAELALLLEALHKQHDAEVEQSSKAVTQQ